MTFCSGYKLSFYKMGCNHIVIILELCLGCFSLEWTEIRLSRCPPVFPMNLSHFSSECTEIWHNDFLDGIGQA